MLESAPGYGATTGAAPVIPAEDAAAGSADPAGALPDGYTRFTAAELTADRLTSAEVYDLSGNRMGEVSELVLKEDGAITHVVMDIGGFLGIGEKRVALPMDEVQITRSAEGDMVRVFVPYDEARLKSLETYRN